MNAKCTTYPNYFHCLLKGMCLFFVLLGHSQTTLSPGDLAITGINMDNPDEISIVFLTEIATGTTFNITDRGWKADASWRAGEAIQTWVANDSYTTGTEIIIALPDLLLSASGDQVIIYQNSSDMVCAINVEGAAVWQADATSSNTSALPQGLINGTHCLAITETDNMMYDRSLISGGKAELLLAINDHTNWSGSDANRQVLSTSGYVITDASLPVELSLWKLTSVDGQVNLIWITESEIENQGFIIERTLRQACAERSRSTQGPNLAWTEIASFSKNRELLGQGSTTAQTEYYFTDKQVKVGESYSYRLSDVDYQARITNHDAISVTVLAKDENTKPGKLVLNKAYPNPFNPNVTLSFDLDIAIDAVSLQIYDLNGVLVQTISSGSYRAGNHKFSWQGTDKSGKPLSSGIYIVRLAAEGQAQIQRVTLLR